ncbi:MAG: fibronectin type III domain-containing protein [Acidobacteria bacterium]|nr:fibronectin type III domain-containing protein [Acidobacteriota bacterium]
MNKNGIVAVVVVITAVVLVGLWVMRSGQNRPGGRRFDCSAPPSAPANLAYTKNGDMVTGTWTAPTGENLPTTYVIEVGSQAGLNNQGTYVVPATQTSFGRSTPAGSYFVRVYSRNACGTSPASNEVSFSVP